MTTTNKQAPLPWLVEGFKYNGLKEIPGPAHNKTIISWLTRLGAWWKDDETPWCLGPDTEVLTDQGFVRFEDFKSANPTKVAQLNRETGHIEYIDGFGYVEKDYDGEVYINTRLGLKTDPNHRYYGKWSGSNNHTLRPINEITTYDVGIPTIKGVEFDFNDISDDELVFMAAFLSDGHYNRSIKSPTTVRFRFSKQRKIEAMSRFTYLSTGLDAPRERRAQSMWFTYSMDLLRRDFLCEYKLMNGDFVQSLSARQCKIFIDAYTLFDGTNCRKYSGSEVFTADERLREQLNFIATMAGYKATPFSTRQVSDNTNIEYLHNVYISKNKHRYVQSHHFEIEQYTGKLYCLQVPSEVFIIRTETGVIIPTGNCGVFTAHCLTHAKRSVPKYWMRAKDYLNWGSKLDRPAYGCIAVTGRKDGGHVFFVVGKTRDGRIVGLGGNQSNAVNLRTFPANTILGYRWPPHENGVPSMPYPDRYKLPVYTNDLKGVSSMA